MLLSQYKQEELEKISLDLRTLLLNKKSLSLRKSIIVEYFENTPCSFNYWFSEKELPSTGRLCGLKEMNNHIRMNIRCGYGKYNYAPCIILR